MRIFRNRKLRIDILTAFSGLITLTVAFEILYSSHSSKLLILDFEKDYYSKSIMKNTVKYLEDYFNKTESMLFILSKNFQSSDFAEKNYSLTFLEMLKQFKQTTGVYVAFKEGTLFQSMNTEGLRLSYKTQGYGELPDYVKFSLRTMQKDNKTGNMFETWSYLNSDFGVVAKETIPSVQYIPTKRDWYVRAELQKSAVWSDIYIFKTSKTAGITCSIPLGYNKNDSSATGVIAADVSVKQFAEILSGAKGSENAKNYLINDKHEIISSSAEKNTYSISNDNSDIPNFTSVSESKDKILSTAAKILLVDGKRHVTFSVAGIPYVASMAKMQKLNFYLLTISPQSDFTAGFDKIRKEMFVMSFFIFLLAIVVVFLISRRISNPISDLCNAAKLIGAMDFNTPLNLKESKIFEIKELTKTIKSMKLSVETFAKYAPKDLVQKLVKTGVTPELGGYTKNITILFSDIENFSTISENLPAEYLILHLSEYFDEMTKEIMRHNGVIDKYIGDSVMAMWGAPNDDEDQVINACYAALSCQEMLEQLKIKWAPLGKPALPTRIGLHHGSVIVGNVGSQDRMSFTAIGDNVNIASRLEGANKFYGTKILASETVEEIARGKILFRIIDKIAVKGKALGVVVYEPLCSMKDADDESYYRNIDLCAKSKEAFELYQKKDFREALAYYQKILKLFPETRPSVEPMILRCEEYLKFPPEENWDGIYKLSGK